MNSEIAKTNFSGDDILNLTDFGLLIGMTINGVKKLISSKKLTEHFSYEKDSRDYLISVPHAKEELKRNVNLKTASEKMLEFLELDSDDAGQAFDTDDVKDMGPAQVMEELRKSELRLSLLQERVMEGKYVDRKAVERTLETMGLMFRDKFTGLAAKLAPKIRAKKSDHEASVLLYEEIETLLLEISELHTQDLTPDK